MFENGTAQGASPSPILPLSFLEIGFDEKKGEGPVTSGDRTGTEEIESRTC